MTHIHRFGVKALIVGLAVVKLGVTLLYFAGTVSITDFFLHQQTAIAQEKKSIEETEIEEAVKAESPEASAVDVRAVLARLNAERQRLGKEEDRIKQQRVRLEELKEEIEAKIETLSKIQQEIEADLKKREAMLASRENQQQAAENANMKMLGKVYASMKPKQAAAIVDKMDIEIIQKVFSYMKGEQVGNILAYVNKDKAAKISERLAEKNIGLPESKPSVTADTSGGASPQ
jgi:flagellar motility protein MotE (MotC chaperone)